MLRLYMDWLVPLISFSFVSFSRIMYSFVVIILLLLSGNAYERFIQVNPVVSPGSSSLKSKEVHCNCWRRKIPFELCN